MELVCALVVTLASLVTATPSGYGIKTGALAKADASAAAGSFGGYGEVPLSIPSGASYSGSFSKSSSSSQSSSSAIASSSSFIFSGAGTIPVIGSNGLQSSNGAGCTGGCQNAGAIGTPNNYGSSSSPGFGQGYNGVNAAATAGGIAGSSTYGIETPCTSGSCTNKKPSSCDGSNCDDNSDTHKKCTSGQCGSTVDSDDIPVNTAGPGSKSTYNSNAQSSNNKFDGLSGSETYAKPTHSSPFDHHSSPSLNVQSHSNVQTNQFTNYNKPATHLTTPKEEPPCTSPNCGTSPGSTYDSGKPSSYNVPTYGTQPASPAQEKESCTSGYCGGNTSDFPSFQPLKEPSDSANCANGQCTGSQTNVSPSAPNSPYGSASAPALVPNGLSGPKNCVNGACNGILSSQPPVGSLQTNYPSYSQGHLTSHAPSGPASCSNGACNGTPTSQISPITSNHPSYSQGSLPSHGATAGPSRLANCANGACNGIPTVLTSEPPKYPVISQGPTYTGSSGNADVFSGANALPGKSDSKPDQKLPPYIGGFGGPPGVLKPNEFNIPPKSLASNNNPSVSTCSSGNCGKQPVNKTPLQDVHNVLPSVSQPTPIIATNSYHPYSCTSGNCERPPPETPGPSYSPPLPAYGFGGPAGVLKPNEFSAPIKPTSPSEIYNPATCTSGNCAGQPSTTQFVHNGPSESSYKPSSPTHGFGGPAGVLKPDEFSAPNNPTGSSGTYNPATCTSGNCAEQPSTAPFVHTGPSGSSYKPSSPTHGFGGPAGVLKPDEFSAPNNPTGSSGTYNPATCTSGNCAGQPSTTPFVHTGPSGSSYKPTSPTPGFGGQAGVLKPDEFLASNKPTIPSGIYNPATCTSGNCASQPDKSLPHYGLSDTSHTHSASGVTQNNFLSSAQFKPPVPTGIYNHIPASSAAPVGSYKPTFCTSGNCSPQDPQTPQTNSKPTYATGAYNPSSCPSGNCLPGQTIPQYGQSTPPVDSQNKASSPVGSYNPTCPSGNCGTQSLPPSLTGHSNPPDDSRYKPSSPAGSYNPSCPSGNCKTQSLPSSLTGHSNPTVDSQYKPPSPAGSYNPSCPSGNCGTQPAPSSQFDQNIPPGGLPNKPTSSFPSGSQYKPSGSIGGHNLAPCSSGNCASQPGHSTSQYGQGALANSGAYAAASANAVAYTGGFGGPPGVLKPYDGGKLPSTGVGGKPFDLSNANIHSSYGKSLNEANTGTIAGAQAIAGAAAGSFGSSGRHTGYNGQVVENDLAGGCKTGCNPGTGSSNNDHPGLNASSAAAKSIASANAGSYAHGGSYASSAASAQAYAGAATKGGYGG